jgi:hypothetical protein
MIVCAPLIGLDFCNTFTNNVVRTMLITTFQRLFDKEKLRKRTGFCKYPIFIPDDEKAYTFRVLKSKPPVKCPEADTKGETLTFVVFGDVHVDRYYVPGAEADCWFPICCRNGSSSGTVKTPAGNWGTIAKCDIPPVILGNIEGFCEICS